MKGKTKIWQTALTTTMRASAASVKVVATHLEERTPLTSVKFFKNFPKELH